VIHGDGSQIRAWCYVDDIVEALLAILERDEAVGEVFNIGNPRSVVTVFDLAARIKRLVGSDSEIVFKPLALHRRRDADPERRQGTEAARVGAAGRPGRRPRAHDRLVPRAAPRAEPGLAGVKFILVAAALAVVAVPGASAVSSSAPVLLAYGPAVISPNGNGVHDDVTLRVHAAPGSQLGLRAYVWGGRLHGWRRLRTGVTVTASAAGIAEASWGATTAGGRTLRDGAT